MARENQGLQIALIVFVMLFLVTTGMSFWLYREWDRKKDEAAAAVQEKDKLSKELATAQGDVRELKRVLGFNDNDTMQVISQEVLKDMQVAAASMPAADHVYRKVVQQLNDTIQKKNQALALAEAEKAQFQKQTQDRDQEAADKIKQHDDEVKKTSADLATVTAAFKKTEGELNAEKDNLLTQRKEIEDKGNQQIKSLQQTVSLKDQLIGKARDVAGQYRKENEKLQHTTFERALGKIQWVNQRAGRVYVNLGEADGLRRLTTFGVFTSATDDVSQSKKKASIEVVEIIGPHLCEARITDDKPDNPVVRGDLVFTPIWAPGKRIHFALAGLIDLDHSGKSDLERVLGVIRTNGAVIDAYQKTDGSIEGKIADTTNYLVQGRAPDEKSTKEMRSNWGKLLKDAEDNLVKQVQLEDLFQRMGYRDVAHVVQYGPKANTTDFRAKPPRGGMPSSKEDISPLFQPRQPAPGMYYRY